MNVMMDATIRLALSVQDGSPSASTPPATPAATPAASPAKSLQVEGLPPTTPAATNPAAGTPLVPASGAPAAGGPPGARPAQPDMLSMLWPMFAIIGVFLVVSIMSGRKDKKRRETMMKSLSKGDRVQTIGGILGTVAEVGDDDVVLRVDEVSNTRIRFAKAAVQQVLRSSAGGSAAAQAEAKPATAKAGV